MDQFAFPRYVEPASVKSFRGEVRDFLAATLADRSPADRAQSWNAADPAFSRQLGARGWIGMTWPQRYGGGERSGLERYVLIEELLAAGAPVAAHWIADRQSGPTLLRYGSEAQRADILPRIARGECFFSIGMSEPDAGSDLAAVRTKAERVAGGYRINGTKLWTTNGHLAHYMILLARTAPSTAERHAGLSQFLVDLSTPGITVKPIRIPTGEQHFNEVAFTDVIVPEGALLGAEGQGWSQVMSELAYERSGPERFLSSFELLNQLCRLAATDPSDRLAEALGRLSAHVVTLRSMSKSVAGALQAGLDPSLQSVVVKDLGAVLEQEIPEVARGLAGRSTDDGGDADYARVLAYTLSHAPSFSLRGGTREILRGIIARGLGIR